jgi:hypothetical protein
MRLLAEDLDMYYSSADPSTKKYQALQGFFDNASTKIFDNPVALKIMQNEIDKFFTMYTNSLCKNTSILFPVFKLYFISDSNEQLYMFDDLYSYAGIVSISVERTRKSPLATALITAVDTYGTLANTFATRRSKSLNPLASTPKYNEELNSLLLKVGCKIQIRTGYSSSITAYFI